MAMAYPVRPPTIWRLPTTFRLLLRRRDQRLWFHYQRDHGKPLPTIVTQPAPFKVGNAVGFNVTAAGGPTLGYQWYLNTVSNYSGATAMTDGGGVSGSTTASVTIANLLDYYFVVVTNSYGSVTSQVAEVAAPLTVASAGEPIWNQATQTNIVVLFSDVLDPATATAVGNYLLDNGASVISAGAGRLE